MSQVMGIFGFAGFHPRYGSFSLGARFETYEPFIFLNFKFVFEPR
jgi:hypothetical protein